MNSGWFQTWGFAGIDIRTLQAISPPNDGEISSWYHRHDRLVGTTFMRDLTLLIGTKSSAAHVPNYIGIRRTHDEILQFVVWPGTHVDG